MAKTAVHRVWGKHPGATGTFRSKPMVAAPGTPTNFALTAATSSTLTFTVDTDADADSYDIYTDAGVLVHEGVTVSDIGGGTSEGTITGLTASTSYTLKAKAVNTGGESAFSNTDTLSTTSGGGGGGIFNEEADFSVTDNEDGTWTITDAQNRFGSNALKYASLGFGTGWLYDIANINDNLVSHDDSITGETWDLNQTRTVKDDSGFRYVEHGASGGESGASLVYWDTANFPEDTVLFQSSLARGTATGVNDGGANTQWKSYRFRPEPGVGGSGVSDMVYLSNFDEGGPGTNVRVVRLSGSLSTLHQNTSPSLGDGGWSRQDWIINPGTQGNEDGFSTTRYLLFGDNWRVKDYQNIQLYAGTDRFRYFQVQDYVNHAQSFMIRRSDFFWQYGTQARFEITDSSDYGNGSTIASIQLPTLWATGSVTIRHWLGRMSAYTGKFLHFIDGNGSAALVAEITGET